MIKNFLKIGMLTAAIAVAVLAIPSVSFAATVNIDGTIITSTPVAYGSGTAMLNAADVLKLENATIDLLLPKGSGNIGVTGDLTIELVGTNTIHVDSPSASAIDCFGEELTFTGSGSLRIVSKQGPGITASKVYMNSGTLIVTSIDVEGIRGDLLVSIGTQKVSVTGNNGSVSGKITEPTSTLASNPNPYLYEKTTQQEQQQPVNREGVVFAMNRDLSYPEGLVFAFHNGYFANFEGVWIHGYAVPEAAYHVDVHNGIAYVFLSQDYLYYVLGLATNEQHLLHVVFSNGYGVTNFTYN